jgi:hypothetical protein
VIGIDAVVQVNDVCPPATDQSVAIEDGQSEMPAEIERLLRGSNKYSQRCEPWPATRETRTPVHRVSILEYVYVGARIAKRFGDDMIVVEHDDWMKTARVQILYGAQQAGMRPADRPVTAPLHVENILQ